MDTHSKVDGVRLHFKDGIKALCFEIYRGVTILYLAQDDGAVKCHFFNELECINKVGEDVESLVVTAHADIDTLLDGEFKEF